MVATSSLSSTNQFFSSRIIAGAGSQYLFIALLMFMIGSLHMKVVHGVSQCVRCDSENDGKGPRGTSCEKKPPPPSPCQILGSSSGSFSCAKIMEYDRNDKLTHVVRDCTTVKDNSAICTDASPENVKLGQPAKSCIWICDTDGCNSASAIRFRFDLLVVGGLVASILVLARQA